MTIAASPLTGLSSDPRPVASGLANPGGWNAMYPATVVDNQDPDHQGRVKVRLPWSPDTGSGRFEAWARLTTLMAGPGRGTWFVPDEGDEVIVSFQAGDPRHPIVLGALWNGEDDPPERMADGNHVRTILTRKGIRLTFDDTDGDVHLLLETPGGQSVRLSDTGTNVVVTDANGNEIALEASGVTVTSPSKVTVQAPSVKVEATSVDVTCPISTFSGVVEVDTLLATTVVSATYSPGAGNVW